MRARLIVAASVLLLLAGCSNSGETDLLRSQVSDLQSQVASLQGRQAATSAALKRAHATEDAMHACVADLLYSALGMTDTIHELAEPNPRAQERGSSKFSCREHRGAILKRSPQARRQG